MSQHSDVSSIVVADEFRQASRLESEHLNNQGGHVTVAVIPAFNEERFIASVVLTTKPYVTHVVVVDDGSTDRTADLAEAAGARVIRQPQNAGKAAALNAGFRVARQFAPAAVVCLDADAQHEPSEIPQLVQPILEQQADVVIGSRFLEVKSKIPKWRQVGQHGLTAVTNTLSGLHVTDSQSGYRAFSPVAIQVLKFQTTGLSLESEMQFLLGPAGLRVSEVPISVRYLDGNKRNPVMHGMSVLEAMLKLVARRRPLIFISLPGLLLSCFGVLLGLLVLRTMEQSGQLMAGTALFTVLLISVGMLLAVTGVVLHSLGHFAGQLREEVKEIVRVRLEDNPG